MLTVLPDGPLAGGHQLNLESVAAAHGLKCFAVLVKGQLVGEHRLDRDRGSSNEVEGRTKKGGPPWSRGR